MEEAEGGAEVGGVAVGVRGGVGLEEVEEVGLGAGHVEGRIRSGAQRGAVGGGGGEDMVGIMRKGGGKVERRERVGREEREAGRAVRGEKGVVESEGEGGDWWGYVFSYLYVFLSSHFHLHLHCSFAQGLLINSIYNLDITM